MYMLPFSYCQRDSEKRRMHKRKELEQKTSHEYDSVRAHHSTQIAPLHHKNGKRIPFVTIRRERSRRKKKRNVEILSEIINIVALFS